MRTGCTLHLGGIAFCVAVASLSVASGISLDALAVVDNADLIDEFRARWAALGRASELQRRGLLGTRRCKPAR